MGKYLQKINLQGEKGVKGMLLLTVLFLLCSVTASAQSEPKYYRTRGSGDWTSIAVWQASETIDGDYIDLTTADPVPTAENSKQVLILNEHTVSIEKKSVADENLSISTKQLKVEGTLIIGVNNTLTILGDQDATQLDLMIEGLVINNGTLVISDGDVPATGEVIGTVNNSNNIEVSDAGNLTFKTGSTYDHQAIAYYVPIPIATWEENSTVKITGLTSGSSLTSGGLDQEFANLIWDTPALTNSTSTFPLNGLTHIKGNFTVKSSGTRILVIPNDLQIDGDFLLDGPGTLRLSAGGSANQQRTVTVNGNVDVTGGTLSLITGTSTTSKVDLNILGNLKFTGGTISKSADPVANINFRGTNQFASISKSFTGGINFIVEDKSILNLGETSYIASTLPVPSKFEVQAGGTVNIGDVDGINTTTGNIRVPQTYAPGSTIVFEGSEAQLVGTDFPEAAGLNLEINNENGVTMNKNLTLTAGGTLTLTTGSLNIGANTLTLGGTVTGPGTLGTTLASNLVINGSGSLGTLNFSSESVGLNNLTISRLDDGIATLGSDMAIIGQLNLANGTLKINDRTLGLYGTANHTGGALASNNETVIAVGVEPYPTSGLPQTGAINLNFSAVADTINSLNLGSLATEVNLGSTLTINETLVLQEGTLQNSGTGKLTLADSSTVYLTNGTIGFVPLTVDDDAYNLVYYTDIVSPGPGNEFTTSAQIRDLTIGGEDNRTIFNLNEERAVRGNLIVANGTFTHTGVLSVGGNLAINSGTFNQNNNLSLGGNLNINNGDFVQGINNLSVKGDITAAAIGRYVVSRTNIARSPVILNGNTLQTISGNLDFNNLTISNTGAEVTLNNDITIRNILAFTSGKLLTTNHQVLLGTTSTTGSISGETEVSHLVGNVKISRAVTAGNTQAFGNIGIEMLPAADVPNPGSITVIRNTGTPISAAAGTPSIARVFDITGPTAGQDITMTLKYLDAELNGNDEGNLRMYKSTDPAIWKEQLEDTTAGKEYNHEVENQVTLTGIDGFSRWTLAAPVQVLPVELTYFTAKKKDQAVELNWETGLEIDNKGFDIQVSTDAVNYRKIGFVSSKNENSRHAQKYTFTDSGIRNQGGTYYYRLRQVDNNGEEKFYGPESVSFSREALVLNAYPNPSSGIVKVQFEAGESKEATVMVVDVHGKTVFSKQVATDRGLNTLQIDLSNQSNGLYILTITSTSGKQQMKLIKK